MWIKVVVLAAAAALAAPAWAESPQDWVTKNMDDLLELYRHFHQHPELSFHEEETAARVAEEWRAAGYEVTTGVGGHGVVGLLTNGSGPTLMLRTDLDALPVIEQTNLTYASTVKVKDDQGAEVGVAHMCGHDLHMTNLVAVARDLATHRDQWRGTLLLVGQPAEERGLGARRMLEAGLFERFPKPDFALAVHVDAFTPTGQIGVRGGYSLANVDSVDITIHGRGGHGAYPHTTIDPIVIGARLVLDLQTIVSREINPTDPAVVTVGSIHGGTKHNVIGDSCQLQLTVRSYKPEVREQLLKSIERKAKAAAESAGAVAPTVVVSDEGTPALFNDEKLVERLLPVFRQALGEKSVTSAEPVMGGEDFSRYGLAGVPIVMFRLGSVDPQRLAGFARVKATPPSLHSPLYYPDPEATLTTGVKALTAAALHLLAPEGK